MTTPRVNVGTKGHCDHGINPMKAAFEAWYDNDDISEPLPDDYTILGKRYLYMGWCAATAEANKRIEALEGDNKLYAECNAELKHDRNEWYKDAQDKRLRILELQASNNDLREAIETALYGHGNDALPKLRKAISTTPAESLQAFKNEVIEKCAKVAMDMPSKADEIHEYRYSDDCKAMAWDISHAIRALKEVK